MAVNVNKVVLKLKLSQGLQSEVSTLSALDDKEDVYTQTDTITSLCFRQGLTQKFNDAVMRSVTYCKTDFVAPVQYQRRANYFNKNRTLTTMKLLREKHRENERLRHHSLNQHLRLICKRVPGSEENGKETKVVMMQRIISYIAYLENTIKSLTSQLNIQLDPSWSLLTSSVKEIEKSGLWEFSIMSSDDSEDGEKFAAHTSCHSKLSSLTTLDSTVVSKSCQSTSDSRNGVEDNSQDSIVPTSHFIANIEDDSTSCFYEDWNIPGEDQKSESACQSDCDQVVFEVPIDTIEGKLMDTPEELEWLGSPDRSNGANQGISENHFGIRCDPAGHEDQSYDLSHIVIVSPNQVLPQITVQKPFASNDNKWGISSQTTSHPDGESMTLCRNSKRKQLSPKRAPLYNIGNWLELPSDCQSHLDELGLSIGNSCYKIEENTSQLCHIKKEIEEGDNSNVPEIELAKESAKVVRDANVEMFTTKLDLRKSSWMNGFMMYSRIHRKRFIKENPGLQASCISKLMGQRWRAMTPEQQKPYREQARICSQELQRMIDESCHC